MFDVSERFQFTAGFLEDFYNSPVEFGWGAYSMSVFMSRYARPKPDGKLETPHDVIVRVVAGMLSIRKSWFKIIGQRWDESYWQSLGQEMAEYHRQFKWSASGRNLWIMGTNYVFDRGADALNNCGFVDVTQAGLEDAAYMMCDKLMLGVGMGFTVPEVALIRHSRPDPSAIYTYFIPDSREGWAESVRMLIHSYNESEAEPTIDFDYSLVRAKGEPIKGFGGTASGPGPLVDLHKQIRLFFDSYFAKTWLGAPFAREDAVDYTYSHLVTDIMNAIGVCVVAGNVRRSAEIAIGSPGNSSFIRLKDYGPTDDTGNVIPATANPEAYRINWGGLSNNSVALWDQADFELVPEIVKQMSTNGEPGIFNMVNVEKYGRYGKKKFDNATGFNPCAEIPLAHGELCNLAELFPSRCKTTEEFKKAAMFATIYTQTVSLLPSHDSTTNAIVSKNRRTGVSITGFAEWFDSAASYAQIWRVLDDTYEQVVEPINRWCAEEAGVPVSIRLTTVKPSGTVSQLAGVSPGMHHPMFRFGLRRIRMQKDSPLTQRFIDAGIPYEQDVRSEYDWVFEYPLEFNPGTRAQDEVGIWEQVAILKLLSLGWADNAVSNTITVKDHELDSLEAVITSTIPFVKSLSILRENKTEFPQMPYERIPRSDFRDRRRQIDYDLLSDWSDIESDRTPDAPSFCTDEFCEIKLW